MSVKEDRAAGRNQKIRDGGFEVVPNHRPLSSLSVRILFHRAGRRILGFDFCDERFGCKH